MSPLRKTLLLGITICALACGAKDIPEPRVLDPKEVTNEYTCVTGLEVNGKQYDGSCIGYFANEDGTARFVAGNIPFEYRPGPRSSSENGARSFVSNGPVTMPYSINDIWTQSHEPLWSQPPYITTNIFIETEE